MGKVELVEREKMEKLIAELDAHPATVKIREDAAAENLAKRREIAARIEELRKEEGATLPKLQAVVDQAAAKHAAAKIALEAATEEVRAAAFALQRARSDFNIDIGICEAELLRTYDPQIDAEIVFFRDKAADLRRPGRINRVGRPSIRNLISWRKVWTSETNLPAILSALAYCRDAIRTLERLKLDPEADLQIIKGLRDNLPDIETYTESTGEGPMEKIVTDPRLLLKSDSQTDREIAKLKEKFQKVMAIPPPAKPSPPKLGKRVIQRINGRLVETLYIGTPKD